MVLFCTISTSKMKSNDDSTDGVSLKSEHLKSIRKQLHGENASLVVTSVQKWVAYGVAAQTLERKVMLNLAGHCTVNKLRIWLGS